MGTLGFGVWLLLESAEWNFGQSWVLLALGLFAVAFLIEAIYLSRIAFRLQRAVVDDATATSDGSTLLGRWFLGYRVVLVVLLLVVWDMIFKPGL